MDKVEERTYNVQAVFTLFHGKQVTGGENDERIIIGDYDEQCEIDVDVKVSAKADREEVILYAIRSEGYYADIDEWDDNLESIDIDMDDVIVTWIE